MRDVLLRVSFCGSHIRTILSSWLGSHVRMHVVECTSLPPFTSLHRTSALMHKPVRSTFLLFPVPSIWVDIGLDDVNPRNDAK